MEGIEKELAPFKKTLIEHPLYKRIQEEVPNPCKWQIKLKP